MMSSQYIAILLLSIISLASTDVSPKEIIQSRSLKVFNNSNLVEDIHCDICHRFTLYYIYAFAARVPPSGAGGFITDEPQFACSHVKPPKNNTVDWAALVYYSSTSCDCSYEEKILNVQDAGYTIALLMEKDNNCTSNIIMDAMDTNDTNVTNITIPAVLLSETVGLLLLSYSSPTDANPTGSMFLEARYGLDYTIITLIVIGCIFLGIPALIIILVVVVACCAGCYECIKDMECTCPRCFDRIKDMECTCPRCFDCIKNMECTCHCSARPEVQGTYSARSGGQPKLSDDTGSVNSETKQPTSAKAESDDDSIGLYPLQEINEEESKAHGTCKSGDTEITGF